jgi:hypothetical protein
VFRVDARSGAQARSKQPKVDDRGLLPTLYQSEDDHTDEPGDNQQEKSLAAPARPLALTQGEE